MDDIAFPDNQEQAFTEPFVVKLRGLPWSVTPKEIMDFFNDCNIVEEEIHLTYTKDGRPSGEAFVELQTEDEFKRALQHNEEHMGKRYIEVFESKFSEMEWVVKRMTGGGSEAEAVVRLRGLPYGCSKQDIADFFDGLDIVPYGITITLDQDGRCTGDAYVQFSTPRDADRALQKHKEKIGHRYIEIFKSSKSEIKYVVGPKPKPLMSIRPGPYDRPGPFSGRARGRGGLGSSGFNDYGFDDFGPSGYSGYGGSGGRGRGPKGRSGGRSGRNGSGGSGGQMSVMNSTTGHSLHMRGLPFDATEEDVVKFFSPLTPVSIRIIYEPNGRPKGEADVDFATHEAATAAMGKHKQNMGRRYIELFLQSTPNGFGGGWSSGRGSSGYGSKSGFSGRSSYGGGYGGMSPPSGYGSGYSGYGGSRHRGSDLSGFGDLGDSGDPYRDSTNFAADVIYPGAGNFFGQQSNYN